MVQKRGIQGLPNFVYYYKGDIDPITGETLTTRTAINMLTGEHLSVRKAQERVRGGRYEELVPPEKRRKPKPASLPTPSPHPPHKRPLKKFPNMYWYKRGERHPVTGELLKQRYAINPRTGEMYTPAQVSRLEPIGGGRPTPLREEGHVLGQGTSKRGSEWMRVEIIPATFPNAVKVLRRLPEKWSVALLQAYGPKRIDSPPVSDDFVWVSLSGFQARRDWVRGPQFIREAEETALELLIQNYRLVWYVSTDKEQK